MFSGELGTQGINFQLNLHLWAVEVLFENPSPVNPATNEHQKSGFGIVQHPHWRTRSHMHPSPWLVHQWNAQMFKYAKHTQPFFTTQYSHQGGQNSALLFWSLVLRSLESQALLFTTALNSSSLLIFAGRNCTFVSKAASSSFPDIISDFSSNKGRLISYFENPTI